MDFGGESVLSSELWNKAQSLFAGGVNSPVRAAVKPFPFYTRSAKGAYLVTEDSKRLIDFVLGYGPLILGHAHPRVIEAVKDQLERGWLYGTPSKAEVELASLITKHIPTAQKVRFVNSGTEATMTALRLSRGFTGRSKILKFDGNYHGAHDYVLIDAGSAASEFGVPFSHGIPSEVSSTVLVCPYNDLVCTESVLRREEIAGVIVEPVMGNMGVIPPEKDFLPGLRKLTSEYGAVLIFDEVITGFRLGLGGAQSYFGVKPDLTTLGKIIGGGFPIGAVCGRKDIMDQLTPSGRVFNAGTFNANPISMTAGIATIHELERGEVYRVSEKAARILSEEIDGAIRMDHVVNRVYNFFQFFLGVRDVKNAGDARKAKRDLYVRIHENLLRDGVFIPPSQFEALFTSGAHDEEVVNQSAKVFKKVLEDLT
ncbi:Glutamate-1-semialdehyde 2,1-aminomutase [Metallosphaera sp. J1]|uniref:glutamate-1-semialdehyde 2,1-aminomutase n=1 Tax=Metallosphaera javensis (ex Hofmann et al. 2022) TaxID=99938 RepID=UPI001EDDF392|nr:glutamate-1-semialdehyde 2,1-aminomutase [Metallosphaera javensis (ex Hofmann et al. 2022)]MCG3109408.1 Glutamate-1-semialdehyde 2,1-aminomutase [Metallosphaera javensis (ex Hofmann et al. 2022)]